MLVIQVKIQVKPEFRQQFLDLMLNNARNSQEMEAGCLLFSVVQDEADPNRLYLFEIYKDEAAFEAHKQMPHYFRWRDGVKDWYASPNVVTRGTNLYPPKESFGK